MNFLNFVHSIFISILIFLIRVYQKVGFFLFGQRCRFYPSCSEYTALSLIKFGLARGSLKSVKRLSRCQPFHPGGVDFP